mgnify:CR=1 FL=1
MKGYGENPRMNEKMVITSMNTNAPLSAPNSNSPGPPTRYVQIGFVADSHSSVLSLYSVSYTHLTLPTNREV